MNSIDKIWYYLEKSGLSEREIASLLACFLEENAMHYILFEIQNKEIKED